MKLQHYSKIVSNTEIETNDINFLEKNTENIYESINVISKLSNKIGEELKKELDERIEDYTFSSDVLEEVFENKEQIKISKMYERIPRVNLLALEVFKQGKVSFSYKDNTKYSK